MPALSLSCRVCATEHPLEAIGTCTRCFGPLDPVYDWDRLRATVTRERIASGPLSIWRYAELLPVEAPEVAAPRAGLHAARPGAAPGGGARRRASSGSSSTPRTRRTRSRIASSPSPRGRRRSSASTTLSCSSTGNLAGAVAARAAAEGLEAAVFVPADLEPEKLAAAAAYGPTLYAVDGHYDHCSRLSVELSFELPWGFVNVNLRSYYAEGSKTIAYEIAEQLGWEAPDVIAIPIASGALFHKVGQGFGELRSLGLIDGASAALDRWAGRGLPAGRDGFREGTPVQPVRPNSIARSLAIGSPADGDFAVSTARETGGAIHAVARGRGRREHGAARARRPASSARPRPA